jgi:hypothetical protein
MGNFMIYSYRHDCEKTSRLYEGFNIVVYVGAVVEIWHRRGVKIV